MSIKDSVEKHKAMISSHKDSFKRKREELSKDYFIDIYEKDLAKLFRQCASGSITIKEFEKKSTFIEEKKKQRLIALGENKNAMTYMPLCEICDDSGYHKGKPCKCLEKIIINDLYLDSGISEILTKENFKTFDFDLFPDKAKSPNEMSPREQIRRTRNIVITYINNFNSETKSLYFWGPTGSGKTFMAHCMAKALIDKGKSVVFTTAYAMIKRLVDHQFGRIDYSEVSKYFDCDFLIIDELGQEGSSEYNRIQMYNVINERMVRSKKTLITSNFKLDNLDNMYEQRLISRLNMYEQIPFVYSDLRVQSRKAEK